MYNKKNEEKKKKKKKANIKTAQKKVHKGSQSSVAPNPAHSEKEGKKRKYTIYKTIYKGVVAKVLLSDPRLRIQWWQQQPAATEGSTRGRRTKGAPVGRLPVENSRSRV